LVGGLFTVLGGAFGILLYNDPLVGWLLQVLGPLTPMMYLDSVATAMLKGLGQQVHSLWFTVIDSVIRIALIILLLPHFGLIGFLFVMVVSNLLTGLLSTQRLLHVSGACIKWTRWIILPILVVTAAGLLCSIIPVDGILYTVSSALILTSVYIIFIPLLGCFNKEDLKRFTARKA